MPKITIELNDFYYSNFKDFAASMGKTVEEYAKQTIENKLDAFWAVE